MAKTPKVPESIAREAGLRSESYPKDVDLEASIFRMNEILGGQVHYDKDLKENHPWLLVIGLPRSGTTLLSQAIVSGFNLGFIDHLAARFWMDPVTGIRLSRHVLGEAQDVTFKSKHGKSEGVREPHEFSYFWHHWFKVDPIAPYDYKLLLDQIDWQGFKTTILNIRNEFKAGMTMKALWTIFYLEQLDRLFEKSVFVYIKRDLVDVCISLKKARIAYYNDPNVWWSIYPDPGFFGDMRHMDYLEQIPRQVFYLSNLIESQIGSVRAHTLQYADLCREPRKTLGLLGRRVEEMTGSPLILSDNLPQDFDFRTYGANDKDYDIFLSEISALE